MTYTLTRQNIAELLVPSKQSAGNPLQADIELIWPARLAQGCNRMVQLRPGLQVWFESLTAQNNLQLQATYEISDPFTFLFVLAGDFRSTLSHIQVKHAFSPKAGKSLLGYGGTGQGTVRYFANQAVQMVQIVVEPWLLHQFVEHNLVQLPLALQQILQGESEKSYARLDATTPPMQMALHQLWQCPCQGPPRQIYLESKAIELIALKLDQLTETQQSRLPKALKPRDIDRIYHAREILLSDLENPPSLMALAKAVGLNDYKLKQGFRHVFSNTVFGCLRDHRMEQARQMLQNSNLSVSEIAYEVGFSNRSHFAAAFKHKFGVNPKAYLTHNRQRRSQ